MPIAKKREKRTWNTATASERYTKRSKQYRVDLAGEVPDPKVVDIQGADLTPKEALAMIETWPITALDSEWDADGNMITWQASNGKERLLIVHGPATKYFIEWFKNPKAKKIFHSASADIPEFKRHAIKVRGFYADTMILDWLVDENRNRHGLKPCCREWLGLDMLDYKDALGYVPEGKKAMVAPDAAEAWQRDREGFIDYATLDAYGTYWLYEHHKAVLEQLACIPGDNIEKHMAKDKGAKRGTLWDYYQAHERQFTETLIGMAEYGIAMDVPVLKEIGAALTLELHRARKIFSLYAPDVEVERVRKGQPYIEVLHAEDLNLKSPQQMASLFYDKLHCRPWSEIETERMGREFENADLKDRTTNVAVVEAWAQEGNILAKALLVNRRATTQLGTFIGSEEGKGLLSKVVKEEGIDKVHTDFVQIGTVTGRISSRDPNCQNIPSRKEKDPFRMRRAFVARPGYKLIVADYSMVELRIMAHISNDQRMIHAIRKGVDLHGLTAKKVFNLTCKVSEVKGLCPDLRNKAKVINFGIQYGMRARLLAANIGCTYDDAKDYIDAYFDLYPGVSAWMRRIVEIARVTGYVTTFLGRRRRLLDINLEGEENFGKRAHCERTAQNTPIQGGAADIIKIAMNNFYLNKEAREIGARLLLQVHDELIVEAPVEYAERAKEILVDKMENAYKLVVPLIAEAHIGDNWEAAKG